VIFGNIRTFVFFLLSCNVSEVLIVGLGSFVSKTLPILPLQILLLNFVTDVFPALALGVGEGDATIMDKPPRDPAEPILTRRHWLAVAGYGLLMAASVLGVFAFAHWRLGLDDRGAVTLSFLTLAFNQLWHVFNMRDRRSGLLRNEITRNRWVWGALALCAVILVGAVHIAPLARVLKVTPPDATGWAVVLVASLIPCVVGQVAKAVAARSR